MSTTSEDDLLRVIEKALESGSGSVGPEARAEDVEGWDSLGHLSILTALDVLFEGKVGGIEELASTTSVREILAALRRHSLM